MPATLRKISASFFVRGKVSMFAGEVLFLYCLFNFFATVSPISTIETEYRGPKICRTISSKPAVSHGLRIVCDMEIVLI